MPLQREAADTKRKSPRGPPDLSAVTVGLREIKRQTSRVLATAQVRPIAITRYRTPYAWLLSHDMWVEPSKLDDFIPSRHSLALLNGSIEQTLKEQASVLKRAGLRCRLQINPAALTRALMLQALYSVPTEGALHDQIVSNVAFRWFVGLNLNASVWECSQFVKDLRLMLGSELAVEVMLEVLQLGMPTILRTDSDFKLNTGLVRAWALRHPRLAKRVPSKAWHDGRLFMAPSDLVASEC